MSKSLSVTSPPDNGALSWLNRVTIAAGGASAMLGLVVLVGWYTRSVILLQIHPALVPMQYNTALGFLLCGLGLLSLVRGWLKPAAVLGAAAAAIGSLTLIEYGFAVDLGIDQLLMEHYVTVKTSHPGRMAPNTALCFAISGVALSLASVAAWERQRFLMSGPLGSLVIGLGLVAIFGYLSGIETAYGWGSLTRMAVHTAAGFVVLGAGVVTFAWRAWLKISRPGTRRPLRADEQASGGRKRIAALVSIMAAVAVTVTGVAMLMLYEASFEEAKKRLLESARSHARLIEAVAQFDRRNNPGDFEKAALDTVSIIKEGLAPLHGTVEIAVARRDDDDIVFFFRQRASRRFEAAPVAFDSPVAEPMRRALSGLSGTMVGLDYRNVMVLAAHEPVAVLDFGIVVKMDIAEVRAPFIRAGLIVMAIAFSVVLFGAALFFSVGEPMVRRLRTSEERFRGVVNGIVDGLITMDDRGAIQTFNPAAERIFGYSADEVVGRNVKLLMPEPYHGEHDGYLRNYLRTGEAKIIGVGREVEGRRKDGTVFPLELAITEMNLSGQRVFAAVTCDITERKRIEAELIQAAKMATLGEMSTGVAHELNQPLNVIRMAADSTLERVEEGDFDAEYLRGKLERISAQTERAAAIIDHMRIFGRKADEEPWPIDLREVTRDALGLLGDQLRLGGIEIVCDFPEVCRPAQGHAAQLEQVVLNLLGNARDAIEANRRGPEQPHRITVKVEDAGPEDKVRLIVEDSGGGIPQDIIGRIFEPFFTTKEAGKGTGLGLSISYGIISDMGGVIEAANAGDGARITITLPVAAERTAAAQ